MNRARSVLVAALFTLAAVHGLWFGLALDWVALAVFALPPVLLAVGTLEGRRHAPFWAGVIALIWFSHGIMVAWTRPDERIFALLETILALVIVLAASLPGLRARFSRRG